MSNEAPIEPVVRIQASLSPKVNLAFHQNAVPVLRELAIINAGQESLTDVVMTLSSEPSFVKTKSWHLDHIGGEQDYHLRELDVSLDPALLGRLIEAEAAQVVLSLAVADEEMARAVYPIELLPRNQWGGVGHMPEMLAAFVQPNDPAVERVLKKAAEILRRNGREGALDGYSGGAKRAWELTSAIWTAVGSLGLDYALPPVSFEHAGQKVRSPGQIVDSGLATCLDSSLLFCSCLEQCGLNPLVVVSHGHAFAGVWLKPEEFTQAVVDDVTALRKRVKLGEIVLFETTLATHRPCPAFSRAAERGSQQISEAEEDKFELALDVRRTRLQRIRPLASGDAPSVVPIESVEIVVEPEFEAAPDLPEDSFVPEDAKPATPQGRLDRWQRKLLDLSLRNTLLNFRPSKRVISLDAPDPGGLEDRLAAGNRLTLLPRPVLMDGADLRSQAIHEERHQEDIHRAHALDALQRDQILVNLKLDDLETRLVDLYRQARANLQEGGANTLFLALGFLSWTRSDKDSTRYRAPLILLPVTLERRSVRSGFSLLVHEDEPRFNPTLIEMLRQDFRLTIPVSEGELPKDESGLDMAKIWRDVASAVKDIKGWEVSEDVVLATFSFAKYLMWKDLVDRTDQLKQNPVVRHLIETPRDPYPSPQPFPDARALDQTHGPERTFCPLPADSSQLSAVMAAAGGKDFVLVGPPGTGKSQTIANLIAQCLAERKTVLFVSEKIAALDVVYRRLREIGLGEFCLELHSNKARKLDILDQLRRSWEAKRAGDADEWRREALRLKVLRDQLNTFVEHLHHKRRNGLSAFFAMGRVVASKALPKLGLSWPSADAHDAEALDGLREIAERLDINAGAVGNIADHPLAVILHADWSPHWQTSFLAATQSAISVAEAMEDQACDFIHAVGLPVLSLERHRRDALAALALVLPKAAGRDWRFVFRPDIRGLGEQLRHGLTLLDSHRATMALLSSPWHADLASDVGRGLELIARHGNITGQLSVAYSQAVVSADVCRLKTDWVKASSSFFLVGWFGKRTLIKFLTDMADGQAPIDPAGDLEKLVMLRGLEGELGQLAHLSGITGAEWSGLSSHVDALASALRFQDALASARTNQPWSEAGLSPVADGRCGKAMADNLSNMQKLRGLAVEIAALDDLSAKTGGLWSGLKTHFEEVETALHFHGAVAEAIAGLAVNTEELTTIRPVIERVVGDGNALLEAGGAVTKTGTAYVQALALYNQALGEFARWAGRAPEADILANIPAALAALCRSILPLEAKLHAWCAWRKVRGEAISLGLAPLVQGVETGLVVLGQFVESFEADYARWWLNATVDGDDILRNFVSAEHENRIAAFRALDDRFTDLTRQYIRASLCVGLPEPEDVSRNSEWGILRHEMNKKKMHLPLRTLMGKIPAALPMLTPCLLMSPLSIAQYLPAETALFDVVVFDEASQITVWDAIGAIARGRQVVMVGDPKQMPPSNFFERSQEDADDDVELDSDLESILDECLGANLPTRYLTWHYRSRYESLIAFSNHRYYDGGLVTFPSPVTEDRAVNFHLVRDGVYEKGGARINKPEAKALVAHLVGRLKDPVFVASKHTIGVVTFNSEQQKLIEDLLDEERRKDPSIEPAFAEDLLEPVFVKNLESVQGDERDIMYFSLTYGPDHTGAISMNFGPMNRDGGERRLNVAITRARQELLVFSSLHPDQLDLSRTKAEGVKDLKHFMEFAERGPRALAEAVFGTVGEYDSPFEKAVADALASKGWRVHPQVGVSAFRIDLGIVDEDAPGRYLAGIECDGATYHRSATARDRDKLREQVLRGLGWEIVRIWSTDWWVDSEGALAKVHERLTKLQDDARARRSEDAVRAATRATAEAETGMETAEDKVVQAEPIEAGQTFTPAAMAPRREGDDLFQGADFALVPTLAHHVADIPKNHPASYHFREADPATAVASVDPVAFFGPDYTPTLLAMIQAVMNAEAPVRDDVLARRIARAHGWAKTGSRIFERVMAVTKRHFVLVADGDHHFVWPQGVDTTQFPRFRRPLDECVRPVDEIALPELSALAREVRDEGFEGDAALSAMAKLAGLQKLRQTSRDRLIICRDGL